MYPYRQSVSGHNQKHFDSIEAPSHVFKAIDTYGKIGEQYRHRLEDTQAEINIPLKIGTQVILISNIDVRYFRLGELPDLIYIY